MKRSAPSPLSTLTGNGLLVLLAIFLTGSGLVLLQHNLFVTLKEKLELRIDNEHNRITIGEMIIADLRQAEALFYRLPTSTDPATQELLRNNIHDVLDRIRRSLDIIEKGGAIDFHLPLNLPDRDEMVTTIYYQPTQQERYILEIIDLRPKLIEIAEKSDTLIDLARNRDRMQQEGFAQRWSASVGQIKDFLKNTAPIFVRMNENANQLFFRSRQNLALFEALVAGKQTQYRRLEIFLVIGTMLTVLLLAAIAHRKQTEMAELHRAKQSLANAYRRFAAIVDGIDHIVYVADAATHEILFINRHARKRFGDVVGRKCYTVFGEKGGEGACTCCRERAERPNGEMPAGGFTMERQHNDAWQEIHGQIIDWDEGRKALHVLVFDITERRKALAERHEVQERLHRAQKMEAIGMMAGGVAHDLNNILAGLVSYPDMLLLDQPEDSPLRRPLTTIKQAGKRAAAIVDDLLSVARGVTPRKEVVELNAIIAQYLDSPEFSQLQRRYPAISWRLELTDQSTALIGSAAQLTKALMNLATNAAEAISGPGTIRITTEVVVPAGKADDRMIVLRVSDNGPGIASHDLERIFEPFYSRKVMGRSGTGLGLAVVWNVVQEHGGTVEVASDAAGTAFTIHLPAGTTDVASAAEDGNGGVTPARGQGQTILVVDDDEQQRLVATSMLKRLGYEAVAVGSGEEALGVTDERQIDLILLDMIMPGGMNGRETYARILVRHPGQKALLSSGFAASEEVQRTLKLGAAGFLAKPYTMRQLADAIRDALS
ncbi:MAG: hybrid sensor histidine kinase/response regulator [Thermodesulfobacteriota bacterium]